MRSSRLIGLAGLLWGCVEGEEERPEPAPETFPCALAALDEDGAVVPLVDAELELGFQGFLMLPFVVTSAHGPDRVNATMTLAFEEELDPVSGQQTFVSFTPSTAGGRVSDRLLLFLTAYSIGAYEGRSAVLTVRLDAPEATCLATAPVRLVDERCDEGEPC